MRRPRTTLERLKAMYDRRNPVEEMPEETPVKKAEPKQPLEIDWREISNKVSDFPMPPQFRPENKSERL